MIAVTLIYNIIHYRVAASILRPSDVSTIGVLQCILRPCVCVCVCVFARVWVCAFIFRFGVSSRVSVGVANTSLNVILHRCPSIIKGFWNTLSSSFRPYKSIALLSIITHPRACRSLFTTTVGGLLLQRFADFLQTRHSSKMCIVLYIT